MISAGVTPLLIAPRTCIAISFSARIAVSAVSVTMLRVWRSRPPRDHTSPHAARVMKSWNGAVSSVAFAIARSTWASPSTARRTPVPCSWRCSSFIAPSRWESVSAGDRVGELDVRQVRGVDELEPRARGCARRSARRAAAGSPGPGGPR